MYTLLQISIEVNSGSVGRIAEQIGEQAIQNGWSSYITYARNHNPSSSHIIKIGTKLDLYMHGVETRFFDNHCFGSRSATVALIKRITEIKPDIIHLHHLHGYFINIEILFAFLKESRIPVVWTFHDCWAFTGHCSSFEFVACEKWKTQCYSCEQKGEYPKSLLLDRSSANYKDKQRIFKSLETIYIVPVSQWLAERVSESFLSGYPQWVIHNGIDLENFSPKNSRDAVESSYGVKGKFIILGVASHWNKKKGLLDYMQLAAALDQSQYAIILVGLSPSQRNVLPPGIVGIERTENVEHLAELYSAADVFVNPTLEDSFPTVNLEAMACGTPVITYRTGGSAEAVSSETGLVVDKGDVPGLVQAIITVRERGSKFYQESCRSQALRRFNRKVQFTQYLDLYSQLLSSDRSLSSQKIRKKK